MSAPEIHTDVIHLGPYNHLRRPRPQTGSRFSSASCRIPDQAPHPRASPPSHCLHTLSLSIQSLFPFGCAAHDVASCQHQSARTTPAGGKTNLQITMHRTYSMRATRAPTASQIQVSANHPRRLLRKRNLADERARTLLRRPRLPSPAAFSAEEESVSRRHPIRPDSPLLLLPPAHGCKGPVI